MEVQLIPFLHLPFSKQSYRISEGWDYSDYSYAVWVKQGQVVGAENYPDSSKKGVKLGDKGLLLWVLGEDRLPRFLGSL